MSDSRGWILQDSVIALGILGGFTYAFLQLVGYFSSGLSESFSVLSLVRETVNSVEADGFKGDDLDFDSDFSGDYEVRTVRLGAYELKWVILHEY